MPCDWLTLAGLIPTGPVAVIDANLSTITAEADKVIRVGGETPWLAHVEFQSGRDTRLNSRLFRYNALLDDRHDLPTRSVVFLLRPAADGPEITGEYRRTLPDGLEHLVFRYHVIRMWQQPVESILHGGLGILPFAGVSDLGAKPLEAVVAELHQRIDLEPPAMRTLLRDSTAIVMGLRHPADLVMHLLRGVREMKASSDHQFILAEGEAKGLAQGAVSEAKRLLLRQADRRLGLGSQADRTAIEQMTQLDRLEQRHDRVYEVATWAELLASEAEAN